MKYSLIILLFMIAVCMIAHSQDSRSIYFQLCGQVSDDFTHGGVNHIDFKIKPIRHLEGTLMKVGQSKIHVELSQPDRQTITDQR